ncbi:MAG: EI24 domain-containing protein, partial [Rhodospirillaceae bacterium]
GILAFALSMMIFPAILTMFAGFFLETVADAVEDRHYPHLPPAHPVAIPDALLSGLALLGKAIVFNLLALPLYLLVPALNLVIFYVLNGFLLGREYFEVVSLRRMDRKAVKRIWTERRGYLVLCGALIAFLSTIPVLNLLSPVLGTAFMVHICERLRRGDQSA